MDSAHHSIVWGTAVCEVYTAVQNDSVETSSQRQSVKCWVPLGVDKTHRFCRMQVVWCLLKTRFAAWWIISSYLMWFEALGPSFSGVLWLKHLVLVRCSLKCLLKNLTLCRIMNHWVLFSAEWRVRFRLGQAEVLGSAWCGLKRWVLLIVD